MDFSREFDGQDHDFPAVANEFRDAPWSRRNYACYALLQWILAHEEDTLRFSDQRLEQLLVNILDMPEVPQGEMANGETRAVFTECRAAAAARYTGGADQGACGGGGNRAGLSGGTVCVHR